MIIFDFFMSNAIFMSLYLTSVLKYIKYINIYISFRALFCFSGKYSNSVVKYITSCKNFKIYGASLISNKNIQEILVTIHVFESIFDNVITIQYPIKYNT